MFAASMCSNPWTPWPVAASVRPRLFLDYTFFGLHVSHPSHISESNCSQAVAMVIVCHSNSPLRHASSCLHELVLALGDSDLEAALLKHIDNIDTECGSDGSDIHSVWRDLESRT